jgi:hypothetical protein
MIGKINSRLGPYQSNPWQLIIGSLAIHFHYRTGDDEDLSILSSYHVDSNSSCSLGQDLMLLRSRDSSFLQM